MNQKWVLIVTGDVQIAEAYSQALGRRGHRATSVEPSAAALDQALAQAPDLIILDDQGATDHFDFIDLVRSTPETEHIHLVVLTALLDPALRERLHGLGVRYAGIRTLANVDGITSRAHQLLTT